MCFTAPGPEPGVLFRVMVMSCSNQKDKLPGDGVLPQETCHHGRKSGAASGLAFTQRNTLAFLCTEAASNLLRTQGGMLLTQKNKSMFKCPALYLFTAVLYVSFAKILSRMKDDFPQWDGFPGTLMAKRLGM